MPIDLLFPTVRRDIIKGINKFVTTLYEHLRQAKKLARASAEKEAERFKRIYDRRAGAVALHPGDKVLTWLDAFIGARRKLKNRWHGQLHMVVRRVADGVPTYVVRNDNNGNEAVFHRARLLLWIAADADKNDGMRSNPAISVQVVDGSEEGNNWEMLVVLPELSYGLSLAAFRTLIGSPFHMTGPKAEAPLSGVVQKGVGQETSVLGDERPPMTGDALVGEDVPP